MESEKSHASMSRRSGKAGAGSCSAAASVDVRQAGASVAVNDAIRKSPQGCWRRARLGSFARGEGRRISGKSFCRGVASRPLLATDWRCSLRSLCNGTRSDIEALGLGAQRFRQAEARSLGSREVFEPCDKVSGGRRRGCLRGWREAAWRVKAPRSERASLDFGGWCNGASVMRKGLVLSYVNKFVSGFTPPSDIKFVNPVGPAKKRA